MINEQNFRSLLIHLGFESDPDSVSDILRKRISPQEIELRVDFKKQEINYPPNLEVHQRQTCNFSQPENAVVLECVHRLLEKGYKPEHIELEPEWKLGHGGKSGRADILVRDQQGKALLIIECKTAGREFDKAWKDTLEDGAQLISYVEQEKATQFICLYASELDSKEAEIKTNQRIISVKDNAQILQDQPKSQSFLAATNAKERFKAWKETYQQEFTEVGIFEANIQPYQIGKNKYTLADDTRPLDAKNIKGKYHEFRTILRKHNVSRRENAFEVLVNLFVCKIVDELENPDDLHFYWKGIAYDNYYDLVDRLQALYKVGMQKFLDQDIVYVSNDEIEKAFWPVKNKRSAVKEEIKRLFRELKFYKGMDFEFIKVFNQTYFEKNAKILIEIIQMWQGYRLTGTNQNQFLGDMFEYFLDNGIKQSEGQFFTPVPICKFIVSSLPLETMITQSHDPLKTIDYACGSGHFLTEYAAQLPPILQTLKPQNDIRKWYSGVYGIEKEDRLAKVAKVSAFMYGFSDIRIFDADALVQHSEITEAGYDVLVANPPFSVEDFLQTVPEEERDRYTLKDHANDLSNRNVQCFFLERAQQLLKPGAVMGIIVPSSILSNTDSMHIATRQILLKYFDFIAITELGGKTFAKAGVNTVVLFMRRKRERPEPAVHFQNRVKDFFEDWATEAKNGGEYADLGSVRHYCAHIGVHFEHYQTLLAGEPNAELLDSEIFKDYRRTFDATTETKNRIASKDFKKLTEEEQSADLAARFLQFCRVREQTKLYYYLLAAHTSMPVLLIKGPSDNKAQQQFLGYEWSGAKGQEGVRYLGGESVKDIITPLFDPQNRANPEKLSYWVQKNFEGHPLEIPSVLQPYVSQIPLVDLLEFGRVEFDGVVSLVVKKEFSITSKWPAPVLRDIVAINPSKTELKGMSLDVEVSFVEMAAVSEQGYIEKEKVIYRKISDFKKGGYTNFLENDILIAKITPCMENGKCALATNLKNGVGFGSTEFHVFRADKEIILPVYLFLFLNRHEVRQFAEYNMTGSSGHRRVPESFYSDLKIPLPPLEIQQQIVAECEKVDAAVEVAKADIAKAKQIVLDTFAKSLQEENQREIKLSNPDLFDIFIGKRMLKSEILNENTGTPIYSANVLQPFGYTHNQFLKDFSKDSVLWGIDGDWMVNLITAGVPFYPTDHCGVIRVKAEGIHPRYLAMALEKEGHRVRFSRSNRAKTEAIKSLKLYFPPMDAQENLAAIANQAEHTIATAQAIIDAAPAQKEAILKKYL